MLFQSFLSGIKSLFRPSARNAEIEAEVQGFREAAVEHRIQQGMSRADAERAARAEIRSSEMIRHNVWTSSWESRVESLWKDVRYGFRQLLRSPGLSVVAVLSLALGIGANTAIFTVIDDLLLKQLPVQDPRMLVLFGDGSDNGIIASSSPGPYDIFPYDFYRHIGGDRKEFEGICAFASFPTMVSVRTGSGSAGPATQAKGHLVSGTFFSVLGAQPLMGRALNADDTATEGSNAVAVISYRYWLENLSADPNAVGRSITINGTSFMVVGVMPATFYGVDLNEQMPDMWLPITMQAQVMMQPSLLKPDGLFWIHMMARRRPDVSVAQAQAWTTVEFQRFLTLREGTQISALRRQQIGGTFIPILPGGAGMSYMRSEYQTPLKVLMAMVGVVLLIACANLANLLLAKSASREREFCARLALGSSRGRIARQILMEALALAMVGGALGLVLAFWGTQVLIHFIDKGAARTALSATPDMRVLLFTFGTCIVTAALFGIAPAMRSSRTNVAGALNANARNSGGTSAGSRGLLPKILIVTQVTLSLVLLSVAGLLLRTLQNLRSEDMGLSRSNVLLVNTNPKFAGYPPERLNALYERIISRVDELPGVRSASMSGGPPVSRGNWGSPIDIDGRPTPPNENISTLLNRVSAGYFETLGIQLLRGRTIVPADAADAVKSVVVNKTFADRYFPNGDAIGHSFTIADPAAPGVWHIVGIVRDSKHRSPAEKLEPFAFLAVTQLTGDDQYAYWLQVKSVGDPAKITEEVRSALVEIDPNLPVLKTLTIDEQLDDLIDLQVFVSKLAGFFALLALTLAGIGLYGVMTYNVVRRTNELGVRMALGAPRTGLLWMVLREALVLLGIGVALGIPMSLAASRAIKSGLFGVNPADPITLIAAVAIVSACMLFGSYMPARRATKINPMVALRYE
ncbi:MAG TPA: ABC transporter permease [Terracidiphilus sp.]|nr:ABC transporter permease [Terracidiphilus sp.]